MRYMYMNVQYVPLQDSKGTTIDPSQIPNKEFQVSNKYQNLILKFRYIHTIRKCV